MHRILLIDDEEDIRTVASLSLEAVAGWTVLTASSGAEGIRMAAEEQPEAILLDVMMPEMDGPTTFRALQAEAKTAGIPVMLLTAKVQGVDQRRFDELGVKKVLHKPFDPMTLADDIRAAHKLAGTLGMFGYPEGTELARSIEQMLEADTMPADAAAKMQGWCAELRKALDKH